MKPLSRFFSKSKTEPASPAPAGTASAGAPRARATPQAKPQSGAAKPRLLFVDHVFHLKTRSFDFLVDILRDAFDVHVIYVDPEATVDVAALEDPAEYVVIGQMDFLTPVFIAQGKRVTVVQMYDGSAALPATHYQLNKQARHLNFSLTLHAKALSLGVESHLVRYFPDPSGVPAVEDFSTLRGFFWQRLPRQGVSLGAVRKMLGAQLDSLHVHTPTDDGSAFDPADLEGFDCAVTTSDWFEKQSDFTDLLNGCNVFIAPRHAEGIGHAFLEAMARGMIVVAYDLPTHNEYITNGLNGVLFGQNAGEIDIKSIADLAAIGAAARTGMQYGHDIWRTERDGIVQFVKDTPQARVPEGLDVSDAIKNIMAAYQHGLAAYVSTLNSYAKLGQTLGNWGALTREMEEAVAPPKNAADTLNADFLFGYNGASGILEHGWSVSEPSHIWAVNREAQMRIPLEQGVEVTSLTLELRGLAHYPVSVLVGDVVVGEANLGGQFTLFEFDLEQVPVEARTTRLRITLRLEEETQVPKVEERALSFALKTMSLSVRTR